MKNYDVFISFKQTDENGHFTEDYYIAIIDKFLTLGEQEVYIKRMVADAVSENGVKFCNLFGMSKIDTSHHDSTLYEVTMIPPKFRIMSKKTKQLYDYYDAKYKEAPYLFD